MIKQTLSLTLIFITSLQGMQTAELQKYLIVSVPFSHKAKDPDIIAEKISQFARAGANINNIDNKQQTILNYLAKYYAVYPNAESPVYLFEKAIILGADPFKKDIDTLTPRQKIDVTKKELTKTAKIEKDPAARYNIQKQIESLKEISALLKTAEKDYAKNKAKRAASASNSSEQAEVKRTAAE